MCAYHDNTKTCIVCRNFDKQGNIIAGVKKGTVKYGDVQKPKTKPRFDFNTKG